MDHPCWTTNGDVRRSRTTSGEVRKGWTMSGQIRGSMKYPKAMVKCEYDMNG